MNTPHHIPEKSSQDDVQLSRRGWLKSIGISAAAIGVGAVASQVYHQEHRSLNQSFKVHGAHQAGIVEPQQAAALIAVFDITASDKRGLDTLLRGITDRVLFLTQGGKVPEVDAKYPPLNSGILGDEITPNGLTVTVSLGSSVFDNRFGLASVKPIHLQDMKPFSNDALEPEMTDGDLSIQICANTAESCIHALRDIIKNTPHLMIMRWMMDGFLAPKQTRQSSEETARNLLGFKDGTSNINDAKTSDELVWLNPENGVGEPAWAQGGSYQAIRLIRNRVEFWDRTPLQEQESIMGRHKMSGAPLGKKAEHDDPDYASDPHGQRIPLDSHIRLANPRTIETRKNLILRRGYNYSRGLTKAGQLDMGLLFICYQANLTNGFITVQNKLNKEPLEEYIKPFGGGYFFTLPGFKQGEYLGSSLIRAVV